MITSISPIDGRYADKTRVLSNYFSEHALFYYRVKVEIEYFLELAKLLPDYIPITELERNEFQKIITDYSHEDTNAIKEIEKTTKHDVKAVEYFLKNKLDLLQRSDIIEWLHFGLTSQDINNTAFPMMMRDATNHIYIPKLNQFMHSLFSLGIENKNLPMLSRTHGQAASPTTLGKELLVFHERLFIQLNKLEHYEYSGKFGGATGNFNAHKVAFDTIDWPSWATAFLQEKLHINRQQSTTQIAHYDEIAEWCQCLLRINTILIDFCRDVWQYISTEYFTQKVVKGEVGSSAMPHKVNPIDFENAEGNLSLANSLLEYFSAKLPISRLQRDLTDSTVLRNIGVPMAHSIIALDSCINGINKLLVNKDKLNNDLDQNYAVLAEAIQTILRREKFPSPYEALKNLTRGQKSITKATLHDFIHSLTIDEKVKQEMLNLSPQNYIGFAGEKMNPHI